jgi:hypothetical protein
MEAGKGRHPDTCPCPGFLEEKNKNLRKIR